MSLNTRGEVRQFTFDTSQLSRRGAATLRGRSRGCTLLCKRLALGLCFPSQVSQQCRGFDDFVGGSFSCCLSSFSFHEGLCATVFNFESFFIDTRGILSND